VSIEKVVVGPWTTNCYLVVIDGGSSTVVIDPGFGAFGTANARLDDNGQTLAGVVSTHGHVDHIADAARLANDAGVPMWLHGGDDFMATTPSAGIGSQSAPLIISLLGRDALPAASQRVDLVESDAIEVAGLRFGVHHTPGHTPGSVVLTLDDGGEPVAFTGDTLFAGSIGRTDLPGGDMTALKASLRRLLALDDETRILPGHGPSTTLGRERRRNPYLQESFLEMN